MSATGDAIGVGILNGQAAATAQLIAAKRGAPLTASDYAQLQVMRAKAEGTAIEQGIQVALAGRPRVFIGTDPNPPSGGTFNEGDIYLIREA